VICVGLNYRDHAIEQRVELPSEPLLFGKFANAVCGHGDPIVLPAEVGHVDAEAELAVVIGRRARRVPVADALAAVAGYVCANDVSARDLQFKDGQWLRAKGFDTFCPLSHEVVPVDELGDASGLRVIQRLNDTVLQDSSTDQLVFGVRELVAHASTVFTLEPGDLLLTGTPAGVGVFRRPPVSLADGDVVEIEIERVGLLRNPVVAET
jgi:2-keto-4-pentenoate hydratase/2-oxohepta-3-ene-1,7-dioic acid hydratase in catechol pathway